VFSICPMGDRRWSWLVEDVAGVGDLVRLLVLRMDAGEVVVFDFGGGNVTCKLRLEDLVRVSCSEEGVLRMTFRVASDVVIVSRCGEKEEFCLNVAPMFEEDLNEILIALVGCEWTDYVFTDLDVDTREVLEKIKVKHQRWKVLEMDRVVCHEVDRFASVEPGSDPAPVLNQKSLRLGLSLSEIGIVRVVGDAEQDFVILLKEKFQNLRKVMLLDDATASLAFKDGKMIILSCPLELNAAALFTLIFARAMFFQSSAPETSPFGYFEGNAHQILKLAEMSGIPGSRRGSPLRKESSPRLQRERKPTGSNEISSRSVEDVLRKAQTLLAKSPTPIPQNTIMEEKESKPEEHEMNVERKYETEEGKIEGKIAKKEEEGESDEVGEQIEEEKPIEVNAWYEDEEEDDGGDTIETNPRSTGEEIPNALKRTRSDRRRRRSATCKQQ